MLGCGYAPVRGRAQPGLRVGAVRNATAQAEAGGIFAAELRRELAGRGRLAPDGSGSPELAAEVLMLRSLPSGAGAEGGATSYRLDAQLRVQAGELADTRPGGEDFLAGAGARGAGG